MMEHYGAVVFGLLFGLFFAFWVWMREELEVAGASGGCGLEGCARGRFFVATLGFLGTLAAMVFCQFIYYV